jgi:hypothetical protein
MAVWFTRWLQCADTILADTMLAADGIAITIGNDVIAPLLCEKFTLFRAEIVTTPEKWEHQQMIVETTCCARENVRMR